jgi:hypothetical protein
MARAGAGKRGGDVLLRSAEMIGWALGGIEREIAQTRERLTALTTQADALRRKLGPAGMRRARRGNGQLPAAPLPGGTATAAGAPGQRRRGRISAEGRRRIAEAARKRWAEYRKKKGKAG